ncbi:MAG: cell division protein ZipA C-terminal FtsZ-binding domain-containing protein [Gammaproteobacteria bacterium]|nr:cell division protein ZipA C-terminal FtsZ-binding domain-containing protein [Gammaproteobacteria bacterium]
MNFGGLHLDLQAILLLCGAGLVAVIALVSWAAVRVDRKDRRREARSSGLHERSLEAEDGDVPLPDDGAEPEAAHAGADAEDADDELPAALVDELDREYREAGRADYDRGRAPSRSEGHPAGVSNNVDYIVRLSGVGAVTPPRLLEVLRKCRGQAIMPASAHGWRYSGGGWQNLEQARADENFGDVVMAMQLADRNRSIGRGELETFDRAIRGAAEQIDREVQTNMDAADGVARAAELVDLCRAYDVSVVLNILSDVAGGFSGGDINRIAGEFGMEMGRRNIYHKVSTIRGRKVTMFSMASLFKPGHFPPGGLDSFRTRGLIMFINIPLTANPAGVFNNMSSVARGMCDRLGGRLVSRELQPLSDNDIEMIRGGVDKAARGLERNGVSPGGADARRLFS